MNLSSLVTDNVSEILLKIVEFTQQRQKILTQNILWMRNPDFIPKDLPVDEFSDLLNTALEEHVRHQRLVLCDTDHIKFGPGGDFRLEPIVDSHAQKLLRNNRDEYLELQVRKLLENSLNQRLAAELLSQRQRNPSTP